MREAWQIVTLFVIACVGFLCWFVSAKLLPRYRDGRVKGAHRPMFQLVIALLVWAVLEIFCFLFVAELNAATALLSVLWCIGLLSWAAIGVMRRTGKQVYEARASRPASAGWRVVGAARATPAAPRRGGYSGPSPTVRSIEGMEVQS